MYFHHNFYQSFIDLKFNTTSIDVDITIYGNIGRVSGANTFSHHGYNIVDSTGSLLIQQVLFVFISMVELVALPEVTHLHIMDITKRMKSNSHTVVMKICPF